MWTVEFESLTVQKEIEQLIRSQQLSAEDQAIIHTWIRQISQHGPQSIQGDFKWKDHALMAKWKGYRSSAFSNRGRIFYRIIDKKILIQIARITTDHDYK